jgi:4'-phosphopantetheinyl transferase
VTGERCEVWWADTASAAPRLIDLLSADERTRYERFRQAADRDRYLVAHALLRIQLGERIGVGPHDVEFADGGRKPRLAGPGPAPEFSLSHSGERVVVAITGRTPVGVDVERVNAARDLSPLLDRVLAPTERPAFEALAGESRYAAFYRYWVSKEAVAKATGDGLGLPFAAIVLAGPGDPVELLECDGGPRPAFDIWLHELDPGAGYVACLAAMGPSALVVEEHDGSARLAQR